MRESISNFQAFMKVKFSHKFSFSLLKIFICFCRVAILRQVKKSNICGVLPSRYPCVCCSPPGRTKLARCSAFPLFCGDPPSLPVPSTTPPTPCTVGSRTVLQHTLRASIDHRIFLNLVGSMVLPLALPPPLADTPLCTQLWVLQNFT